MHDLLPYLIFGVTSGSVYALIGLGLVLTYKVSNLLNLAHGALATAAAYTFYALHEQHHIAWPIAALISVLGCGLVFGLVLERIANGLEGADLALKIVATVGVLLVILGICPIAFGDFPVQVQPYLPVHQVHLFGVFVTVDKLIIVALAALSTIALYAFFRLSRLGKSMRAVVDNPRLLSLAGTNPTSVRRAAWIIGSCFATLSGTLLVETLGSVDASAMTALVIQAFAAAALGSFTSLPLTYVGGLLIGVAASVTQKLVATSQDSLVTAIPAAMPFLILFLLMLVMPRARLAVRSAVPRKIHNRWSAPRRVQVVGAVVGLAFLAAVPTWAGYRLGSWTAMLTFTILFLSVGLLVRTSGQVALCHATFAAIGAVAFSHLAHGVGISWIPALLLAGLAAVPVGAIVAIPAIRLSGVFLALATMGFGLLAQSMFYSSDLMFGTATTGIVMPLPHLSWLTVDTATGFYYVVLTITVIAALVVVAVVRSRLGRLLAAMADSPRALTTSGASVNATRLIVFCISAYLASIAGALYGVYLSAPSGLSFDPFSSATFVTLIVIMAGRAPWNALLAAAGYSLISAYWNPSGITNYLQIAFGGTAILMALYPPPGLPGPVRAWIDRLGGRADRAQLGTTSQPAEPNRSSRRVRPSELVIRDLTVRFGGITAVHGLKLVAPSGRITGLIGPNGAGKTTTFNACSGLVRPSSGQVLFAGRDVSRADPARRARLGLGRSYQHIELWDSLTVAQNVAVGLEAGLAGRNAIRQLVSRRRDRREIDAAVVDAIQLCGLQAEADLTVASLSTGKRRLVELARCLGGSFSVVLLDEPSSGLDQYETDAFARILRRVVDERGLGILLVEHDMRLVMDICEHIYVLDFGEEIFQGTPAEVAGSVIVRDAYLGSELPPHELAGV